MNENLDWWTTWTPELAYVLGFAFADGGIGRHGNSLTLAQSEKDILVTISEIAPDGHLNFSEGAKVWKLRYCEPGLREVLASYGIVPNKTAFGFWPDGIPRDLIPHYIRGFFDGDGHVSIYGRRYRVMFVAHLRPFLERLKAELGEREIRDGGLRRDGNNFRLVYNKATALLSLFNLLYADASIYCERKKRMFDRVKAYIDISLGRKGSAHGNAKLSEKDVLQMRLLWKTGQYTQIELAEMFGVNNRNVSMIVNRQAWRHVP